MSEAWASVDMMGESDNTDMAVVFPAPTGPVKTILLSSLTNWLLDIHCYLHRSAPQPYIPAMRFRRRPKKLLLAAGISVSKDAESCGIRTRLPGFSGVL